MLFKVVALAGMLGKQYPFLTQTLRPLSINPFNHNWDLDKLCRLRSDAAFWSGFLLFANMIFFQNEKVHQSPLKLEMDLWYL